MNGLTGSGETIFPHTIDEMEVRHYERMYNQRIAGSKKDLIYRNRTHNVAWAVVKFLEKVSFETMETTMFFSCSKELLPYVREFEKQLEIAKLQAEKFRKNLHDFYLKMSRKIQEENAVELIAEFHHALVGSAIRKEFDSREEVKNVFSAYLSLSEQLFCYLIDDLTEEIIGIRQDGTFIVKEDIYPLIDYYQYEFEDNGMKKLIDRNNGKRNNWDSDASWSKLRDNFAKIGYEVEDIDDLNFVIQSSNNYTNNNMAMMYYIDERNVDMIPNGHWAGYTKFEKPRKWLSTEEYKEALRKRNYTLPANGVVSSYYYAGGIREIVFREIFKDDKVILLWKMTLDFGGVTTGYYDTTTQLFYSNYMMCSDNTGTAEIIENFVLENYYMLTVKNTDTEKKQRLKMIVCSDDTAIDKIPRWAKQPIVEYNLCVTEDDRKTKDKAKTQKRYKQGEYDNSKIAIGANVRRLPIEHKASWEALQNASKYGYEIEDGYTFVLPFERNQRHIKIKI